MAARPKEIAGIERLAHKIPPPISPRSKKGEKANNPRLKEKRDPDIPSHNGVANSFPEA